MNTALLWQIVNRLERDPERFDITASIYVEPRGFFQRLSGASCKTVCCIAGECYLALSADAQDDIELYDNFRHDEDRSMPFLNIFHFARHQFGLTNEQAQRLFFLKYWPTKFREMYLRTADGRERVYVLRQAVEDFILTNGWEPIDDREITVKIERGQVVTNIQ